SPPLTLSTASSSLLIITSSPLPPTRKSGPAPPATVSLPPSPTTVSRPGPPSRSSSPVSPRMASSPVPPALESLPAALQITSSPPAACPVVAWIPVWTDGAFWRRRTHPSPRDPDSCPGGERTPGVPVQADRAALPREGGRPRRLDALDLIAIPGRTVHLRLLVLAVVALVARPEEAVVEVVATVDLVNGVVIAADHDVVATATDEEVVARSA